MLYVGLSYRENRRKFTTEPVAPQRCLEVHSEKQRDLSKRERGKEREKDRGRDGEA